LGRIEIANTPIVEFVEQVFVAATIATFVSAVLTKLRPGELISI